MTEPTITCPNCKTEIHLTESLAAPLLAATRKQFEQQLLQKDEQVAKREQSIRDKKKQIAVARGTLDEQVITMPVCGSKWIIAERKAIVMPERVEEDTHS